MILVTLSKDLSIVLKFASGQIISLRIINDEQGFTAGEIYSSLFLRLMLEAKRTSEIQRDTHSQNAPLYTLFAV